MRVSDMVKTDPLYRYYRKAISLLASLDRREDFYQKRYTLQPRHLDRLRAIRNQLTTYIARLDKIEFISDTPATPACLLDPVARTMAFVFEGLPEPGKASHGSFEAHLCAAMTLAGRQRATAEHKFWLSCEVAYRAAQGWAMVFNTLTVNRHAYLKVFGEDSREFRAYIDAVDRACAQSAYGSVRLAKGKDYHSYFAVVEEGSLHGRLHIHVLHFIKTLPEGCVDPNLGRRAPSRWELDLFRRWWPHGHSSPLTVRYSAQDYYGRAGYRWPLDKKTGQPFKSGSPQRVAGYVSKYILKSYASQKRSEYLWRVRKKQRLGRQLLSTLMRHLPLLCLVTLSTDTATQYRLNNRPIPNQLLRLEALRTLRNRLSTNNLFTSARALEPRPSLLRLWRDSIDQSDSGHSFRNTMFSDLTSSPVEAIFDDARTILRRKFLALSERFYPVSTNAGQYQSTRDFVG